jgi:hypothetical protein
MSSPKFSDLSIASKTLIVIDFMLLLVALPVVLYGNRLIPFINVDAIPNNYLFMQLFLL